MSPKQIKIKDKNKLHIKWDNESESEIGLVYLRDECPCAVCKGETVLMKSYRPAKKVSSPEMYKIKDISVVGGYAIQITWRDGHNTGIYTYQHLKQLAGDEGKDINHNYDDLI